MGAAWVQSVLYPLALEGGNSNYNSSFSIPEKIAFPREVAVSGILYTSQQQFIHDLFFVLFCVIERQEIEIV